MTSTATPPPPSYSDDNVRLCYERGVGSAITPAANTWWCSISHLATIVPCFVRIHTWIGYNIFSSASFSVPKQWSLTTWEYHQQRVILSTINFARCSDRGRNGQQCYQTPAQNHGPLSCFPHPSPGNPCICSVTTKLTAFCLVPLRLG